MLTLRAPFYVLLLATTAWLLRHPTPPTPALGAALPAPCPAPAVLVELRGLGLACLPPDQAARRGALAGAVLPVTATGAPAAGPPGRMPPERWLAAQIPLDPNQATVEELIALPDIGPALAARIIAARPLRGASDLTRVPGIGRRRVARLQPLLRFPPPPPGR